MKHWAKILAINALLLGFIVGYLMSAKQHNIVKFEPNEQQLGPIYEANPIKNWTSSEYVTYTDLNNNFNHLHANLGHGHGPIITANDISANAGIRPEQTTFGAGINRNLVFEGTFTHNPDASWGTLNSIYMPINASGTLAVTVRDNINGANITATGSGTLSDGGSQIYTVFYRSHGADAGNILCVDVNNANLSSSLSLNIFCDDPFGTPGGGISPAGLSLLIYSNAAGL